MPISRVTASATARGGGDYTALGVAMNSDTLALEVVYVSHATEDWWTRSLEEFLDGRFRYLMLAPRTAAELGLTAIAESRTAPALDPATRALVAGLTPAQRRLFGSLSFDVARAGECVERSLDGRARRVARTLAAKGLVTFGDRGPGLPATFTITDAGWPALKALVVRART